MKTVRLDGPEPTTAFWRAHREGAPIALRTSGTTGAARTIVRSTCSWTRSFAPLIERTGLHAGDRMWIPGPLDSTMNLFSACLCEYAGAAWDSRPEGASWATLTPSGLARALDSHAPMKALVAGDGLSRALWQWATGLGWDVVHYYGAAELSLVALGRHAQDLRPFEAVEIDTADDRIWVRSPWLADGCLEPEGPGAFRRRADGFVTVGDRGRLDNGLLQVWGRAGAITTAGATVELAPLRARLAARAHGEVVLLGLPHPELGQVLAAVTTSHDDLRHVRGWARRNLSGPQRPRVWRVIPRLPRTTTGKIDLHRLAEELR
ncbi:AMP-binding enzyme [Propionibacterium australiense]|uniref:AMP-binding enzyme n=1 Tax=Propionibacterium australiense TaxID=119981 RepID=A0A383S7R8_9ACTN|nr:AMP-binding protein [Propionibacterium australiense]SYZ33761.1 AMP-binding enzyme [Propionibacterium australiense]VEH88738.1 2-succinylbenzoate--CoA ligase [Propionibacterium australiense]